VTFIAAAFADKWRQLRLYC